MRFEYNNHHNILLEKYKAIYFPIPKVACSSLKKFCSDMLEIALPGENVDEEVHHVDYPYVDKEKIEKYHKYFKFVFVRNPWDRLVSCYKNKVAAFKDEVFYSFRQYSSFKVGMSFEEFVQAICEIDDRAADEHFRSQYFTIINKNGELFVDFVGKFEQLGKDFEHIAKEIGLKRVTLPHLMKSSTKKSYKNFYSEKTKRMVAKRYAKDIELFGYSY